MPASENPRLIGAAQGFLLFFFFFLSRPEVALKVLDWNRPTGPSREARLAPRTRLDEDWQ